MSLTWAEAVERLRDFFATNGIAAAWANEALGAVFACKTCEGSGKEIVHTNPTPGYTCRVCGGSGLQREWVCEDSYRSGSEGCSYNYKDHPCLPGCGWRTEGIRLEADDG